MTTKEKDNRYYDEMFAKPGWYHDDVTHYRFLPIFQELIVYLLAVRKPNDNILEIGCGMGQLAAFLESYQIRNYKGIDISKYAISQARKAVEDPNYILQVASGYDFMQYKGIDIFLSTETLEHVDDYKMIANIPKGKYFIFSVPSIDDESHLRFFPTLADVISRYESVLEIQKSAEVYVLGARFYVILSKKK